MKKLKNMTLGYTIIELLAVVSILVVISGVIAGILYSTLRGTSRVRITTEVAQNGDYALSVIKKIVADSRNITAINGTQISDCTPNPNSPSTENVPTPTPSGLKPSITFRRIDGTSTVLSCPAENEIATIAQDGVSLINTENVKVENCVFSCSQLVEDPYSVPVVGISFRVTDLNTGLFETRSFSDFNISTSLRTYSP
jgi:type II secretory pathway pseudopilin PulG